ncbi:ORF19 [Fowl aviadenovirus E]|uniref:ORF19 n=1 Tax=Fowl aviadenovirus E TaxID=190065 RepID=A0A650BZF1_9ADEN|nr:ORF19 [Fowl aviadenovirus E]QGQ62641.1 ORF19 [Fowl aviadenovirus E]
MFQLVGVLFGASVLSCAKSAVACPDSGNRSCVARPDSLKLDAPRGVGRLSRPPSKITWYGAHGGVPKFHDATYQYGVYHRLHSALAGKTDIIVLIPGYYMGYQSFRKVLRFHQKMTPAVALLLVDWNLYYDYDGLYVDFGKFLSDIPHSKRLHCIGHSAGAHACSTICRQWTYISGDRRCTRIVGLEPTFVTGGLDKNDADYVAVLKTEGSWITGGYTASEDIMLEDKGGRGCGIHGGWSGRVCAESVWGQTVCEEFSWRDTWSKSGCFHRLIVPKFLKTLDVRTGLPMFHLLNEGFKVGPVRSTWNGYTMSRDYRYASYFNHISISYMTEITYSPVLKQDFVTPIMIIVVASSGSRMFIGGYSEQTLRYGRYDVLTAVGYTELAEEVLWIRHWNPSASIYLVYVITPQGFYQDSSSAPSIKDRKVMTGGCVRTMHCNPTRDPFGRPAHYCMVTKERFPLMSYRTMLNPNGGSQVSVPPQSGCLADRDASIAMIPIQLADVEVKVGHKLKVDLSKSPFWLTSIQLTDSSGTHKLYSFWDVCQTAAQCVFQLDRMKKEFTVTFFNADVFELEFFLEFEVIKLKVTVSPLEPVSVEFPPEPTASLNSTSTDSASTVSTWNFSAATPSSSDFWSTSETASEEEVVTVQLNETEPVQAVALRAIDEGSRVAASGASTGTLFLTVVGLVFLAMVAVLVSTAIRRKKVAMGLRDPSLRLLSSEESSTL